MSARLLAVRVNNFWAQWAATSALGELERSAGATDLAQQLGAEALELARRAGASTPIGLALCNLGQSMLADGQPAHKAAALFSEALHVGREAKSPLILSNALDGFAKAVMDTQPEGAARIVGAAFAMREFLGLRPDPLEERDIQNTLDQLEDVIGPDRLRDLMAEAEHLRPEDAAQYALEYQVEHPAEG
jgi:hypothetical protein